MPNNTPMNSFVVDTMALVLWLENRRMGTAVRAVLANAQEGRATIHIPAMVWAEVLYLSQRKRIELDFRQVRRLMKAYPFCQERPLDLTIIEVAASIDDIPELHDRLIAATAVYLQCPILTNDPLIRASKHIVQAIW